MTDKIDTVELRGNHRHRMAGAVAAGSIPNDEGLEIAVILRRRPRPDDQMAIEAFAERSPASRTSPTTPNRTEGTWCGSMARTRPSAAPAPSPPLWAAPLAPINRAHHGRIGFIQPLLYGAVNRDTAFHDFITGNNGDYRAGPG